MDRQGGVTTESEITPAMIEAGVLASDLEGYEYGWGDEASLVERVYLAMRTVERSSSDASL